MKQRQKGYNIRFACDADIPRIHHLLTQVNAVHAKGRPDLFKMGERKYTDDELKGIFRNTETPVIVCTDADDSVVGYAFCIFERHEDSHVLQPVTTLYIDDICVDETLRGQHIGKRIYEAVLAFAKEQHCYNVTLNVWTCNPTAMKFYESLGLVPQKVGMEHIIET